MKSYAQRQKDEMHHNSIKAGMAGALIGILIILLICFFSDKSQQSHKKPRISSFQKLIMEHREVNKMKKFNP